MGGGRHQVRDKARALAPTLDHDGLVIGDVPGRGNAADARQYVDLPLHRLEPDGLEVVREIARLGALVGVARELELPPLHHVGRLRKCGEDAPLAGAPGVASRVVEVQVGVDHPAHLLGPVAELGERVFEAGAPLPALVLDAVDVLELVAFLVAEPGVDQHESRVVLHEEAAQRQRDAVAVVRGDAPLPQGLRHHAEHGPAVQVLHPGFERMAGQAADLESRVRHQSNAECGVRNAECEGRHPWAGAPPCKLRTPHSALRTLPSSSSVPAPCSFAIATSRCRILAAAIASGPARWRRSISIPKNCARVSRLRDSRAGRSRRASRRVQTRGPWSTSERARSSSTRRNVQSKRTLWATNTAPVSCSSRRSATAAKQGAARSAAASMPVSWETNDPTATPGLTRVSKAGVTRSRSSTATAISMMRSPRRGLVPVASTSTTAKRQASSPGLDACRFAVVDVEATGTSPRRGDRIIEIAVAVLERDRVTPAFETLVNPGVAVGSFVSQLTGIDAAALRAAPCFAAVADRLLEQLTGAVFVAHNVRFDWTFLLVELERARSLVLQGPRVCTLRLARRLLPALESRSVDTLAQFFGIEIERRHRAGPDAMAAARILQRLVAIAKEQGAGTLADLGQMRNAERGTRNEKPLVSSAFRVPRSDFE